MKENEVAKNNNKKEIPEAAVNIPTSFDSKSYPIINVLVSFMIKDKVALKNRGKLYDKISLVLLVDILIFLKKL